MKTLNINTEKARNYIKAYSRSSNTKLSDCYKSYSNKKEAAFEWCILTCSEMDGYDLKIISHNTCFFSVGFKVQGALIIITPSNTFVIR